MRLAGGVIVGMHAREPVFFAEVPDQEKEHIKLQHQIIRRLLPGFALVLRHDLLQQHWAKLRQHKPDAEMLDAWLDFYSLRFEAAQQADKEGTYPWTRRAKPGSGWLVPLPVGYRALGELQAAGSVGNARDPATPFCFVEPVYSIGQWLSPHRVQDLGHLLWHLRHEDDLYLCHNPYQPASITDEDEDDDEEDDDD